jgi:DNA replication protein DnaC
MRTEIEVRNYSDSLSDKDLKKAEKIEKFKSCIPFDFWDLREENIDYNLDIYKNFIAPYVKNLNVAFHNGYGLLMGGPNGTGKSYYSSFILLNAIYEGRTAYYTTVLELDNNIKKGFNNYYIKERLDYYLTSDFLCLDEMGKETFKSVYEPTYLKTQMERILKYRFDNNMPTLLATNFSITALNKLYGPTIASIFAGRYQIVLFPPGDLRKLLGNRIQKDMGFKL